MFNPSIINDHIGIYENAFPNSYCDEIINDFEKYNEQVYYTSGDIKKGENIFPEGIEGRKDIMLFYEYIDLQASIKLLHLVTKKGLDNYIKYYPTLKSEPIVAMSVKLQKTETGGGYHKWHHENDNFWTQDRVIAWMVYLNDIPLGNGGATDFLSQKISIQPKKGTLLLWPAGYTHVHKGGFLTGDIPKYIATGWFIKTPPIK
tara:strand:- start:45 stop:653 length:609 start_codon:yes stop_codon:yes gene_type:complete